MAEGGKGVALVILGIIAVIAVVGMVLLFSKAHSTTGKFVEGAEWAQYAPAELCEERIGCPLKSIEGGTTYSSNVAPYVVCACPGGDVTAPLVQKFDWRTQFYPQG